MQKDETLCSVLTMEFEPVFFSGVKAHTNMDDLFSELGSVKKDRNREAVVELLTKKPELSQVPTYNLLHFILGMIKLGAFS